jgi:hypothetical protein
MTLLVRAVPVQNVAQAWTLVEKYITDAQQYCGDDYTLDQVKVYLAGGNWVLLVAVDEEGSVHGAATVNFFNMPNDRIAFITFIGGKLISNKDTFSQMAGILKGFGATKIQGAARESIARLWRRYGFEERYRIVETKI